MASQAGAEGLPQREARPSRQRKLPAKLRDESLELFRRYCVCRKEYRQGPFMIECDTKRNGCLEWVHGACVGISEEEAKAMGPYVCEPCRAQVARTQIAAAEPPSKDAVPAGIAPAAEAESMSGAAREGGERPRREKATGVTQHKGGESPYAWSDGPGGASQPEAAQPAAAPGVRKSSRRKGPAASSLPDGAPAAPPRAAGRAGLRHQAEADDPLSVDHEEPQDAAPSPKAARTSGAFATARRGPDPSGLADAAATAAQSAQGNAADEAAAEVEAVVRMDVDIQAEAEEEKMEPAVAPEAPAALEIAHSPAMEVMSESPPRAAEPVAAITPPQAPAPLPPALLPAAAPSAAVPEADLPPTEAAGGPISGAGPVLPAAPGTAAPIDADGAAAAPVAASPAAAAPTAAAPAAAVPIPAASAAASAPIAAPAAAAQIPAAPAAAALPTSPIVAAAPIAPTAIAPAAAAPAAAPIPAAPAAAPVATDAAAAAAPVATDSAAAAAAPIAAAVAAPAAANPIDAAPTAAAAAPTPCGAAGCANPAPPGQHYCSEACMRAAERLAVEKKRSRDAALAAESSKRPRRAAPADRLTAAAKRAAGEGKPPITVAVEGDTPGGKPAAAAAAASAAAPEGPTTMAAAAAVPASSPRPPESLQRGSSLTRSGSGPRPEASLVKAEPLPRSNSGQKGGPPPRLGAASPSGSAGDEAFRARVRENLAAALALVHTSDAVTSTSGPRHAEAGVAAPGTGAAEGAAEREGGGAAPDRQQGAALEPAGGGAPAGEGPGDGASGSGGGGPVMGTKAGESGEGATAGAGAPAGSGAGDPALGGTAADVPGTSGSMEVGEAAGAAGPVAPPAQVPLEPPEEVRERLAQMGAAIEREMFKAYGGVTKKYKERTRSLLFNLKDRSNPELRARVLRGEIEPESLVTMTADQLASQELAQWRTAKAEEAASQVVLMEESAPRFLKKTHKGEVELVMPFEPQPTAGPDLPPSTGGGAPPRGGEAEAEAEEGPGGGGDRGASSGDGVTGLGRNEAAVPGSEGTHDRHLPAILSLDEFMEAAEGARGGGRGAAGAGAPPAADCGDLRTDTSGRPNGAPERSQESPSAAASPRKRAGWASEVAPAGGEPRGAPRRGLLPAARPSAKRPALWEGILQLSGKGHEQASAECVVRAAYRSGERLPLEECLPSVIELKGRVKVADLDHFLQQLRKSRSRAIGVVSFLHAPDLADPADMAVQTAAMSELAEQYSRTLRVGKAEPNPGTELYLLPVGEESLELLRSHGHANVAPGPPGEPPHPGGYASGEAFLGLLIQRRASLESPTWRTASPVDAGRPPPLPGGARPHLPAAASPSRHGKSAGGSTRSSLRQSPRQSPSTSAGPPAPEPAPSPARSELDYPPGFGDPPRTDGGGGRSTPGGGGALPAGGGQPIPQAAPAAPPSKNGPSSQSLALARDPRRKGGQQPPSPLTGVGTPEAAHGAPPAGGDGQQPPGGAASQPPWYTVPPAAPPGGGGASPGQHAGAAPPPAPAAAPPPGAWEGKQEAAAAPLPEENDEDDLPEFDFDEMPLGAPTTAALPLAPLPPAPRPAAEERPPEPGPGPGPEPEPSHPPGFFPPPPSLPRQLNPDPRFRPPVPQYPRPPPPAQGPRPPLAPSPRMLPNSYQDQSHSGRGVSRPPPPPPGNGWQPPRGPQLRGPPPPPPLPRGPRPPWQPPRTGGQPFVQPHPAYRPY